MKTSIEILRANVNSQPGDWVPYLSMEDLASVLRDAERYKALEKAVDVGELEISWVDLMKFDPTSPLETLADSLIKNSL